MGTQTSRATYSRLLVNSFMFGCSFHSVDLILQAVHPLVAFDGAAVKLLFFHHAASAAPTVKPVEIICSS